MSEGFEAAASRVLAVAGAALLASSVGFSVGSLQGCGPCWPGRCPDEGATPTPANTVTPTPSPTAAPDCTPRRQTDRIVENLWQANTTSCPRLLLDPSDPDYDAAGDEGSGDGVCEVGVSMEGADDNFTIRFACNANEPWVLAPASPGTATIDDTVVQAMTVPMACPGEVPVNEIFVLATDLEPILWGSNRAEIGAAATSWREGCIASDATRSRLETCRQVCAGDLSLREAFVREGISMTDAVNCYLSLYDPSMPAHAGEERIESTDGAYVLDSACACRPNTIFLDCVTGALENEPCLEGTIYDESCGATCFQLYPTSDGSCNAP